MKTDIFTFSIAIQYLTQFLFMIRFTKSNTGEDTEWSTSEMELTFLTGLEICLALVMNKLMNWIRTVCRTGGRADEGNLERVYA
jgi:hypothetical protein